MHSLGFYSNWKRGRKTHWSICQGKREIHYVKDGIKRNHHSLKPRANNGEGPSNILCTLNRNWNEFSLVIRFFQLLKFFEKHCKWFTIHQIAPKHIFSGGYRSLGYMQWFLPFVIMHIFSLLQSFYQCVSLFSVCS